MAFDSAEYLGVRASNLRVSGRTLLNNSLAAQLTSPQSVTIMHLYNACYQLLTFSLTLSAAKGKTCREAVVASMWQKAASA